LEGPKNQGTIVAKMGRGVPSPTDWRVRNSIVSPPAFPSGVSLEPGPKTCFDAFRA